jgi:hypothetical protein
LEAGKLRALAATSSTRIEPLPDLPTVAESGYKRYDVQVRFDRASKDSEENTVRTRRLVHCFNARARGQTEAPDARALSGGQVRGRLWCLYPTQYDDYTSIVREADIKVE